MQLLEFFAILMSLNTCVVVCVLNAVNIEDFDHEKHDSRNSPRLVRKVKIIPTTRDFHSSSTEEYQSNPNSEPWIPMVNQISQSKYHPIIEGIRPESDIKVTTLYKKSSRKTDSQSVDNTTPEALVDSVSEVTLRASIQVSDLPDGHISESQNSSQVIPLDVMRNLATIENSADFYKYLFGEDELILKKRLSVNNISHESIEGRKAILPSANVPVAPPAPCIPTVTAVSLPIKLDPSVIVWPTCTRIERCNGCCSSDLLQCEADQVEMVEMNVIKSAYVGNGQFQYSGMETVSVEKHLSCKCACKVKASHCNHGQMYDQGECRCRCNNIVEKDICAREHATKFWDMNSCQCKCRRETACSTGMYFAHDICKCTKIPHLGGHHSTENELSGRGAHSIAKTTTTTTTTTEKTWDSWLQSIKNWKKRQP